MLFLLLSLACAPSDDDSGAFDSGGIVVDDLAACLDADRYLSRLDDLAHLTIDGTGDRLATSEGHAQARAWARAELEALGWTVEERSFQWGIPLRTATNLVATSPGGSPERVVLVGAHLDTVRGAPGVNDNGTGVVAVIGLAEALTFAPEPATAQVQVILWDWEEAGVLGSQRFVQAMSDELAAATVAYVNVDMIGSPNGIRMILDDEDAEALSPGSAALAATAGGWLEDYGLPWEAYDLERNSDHIWFIDRGIPITSFWAGAGGEKSAAQADVYGGTADEPMDSCYHTACDDLGNVQTDFALQLTGAATHLVGELAYARLL
ncbi:MAG: M28 family peptidase [Alphaproteobacteria bacterium]|nr:M28 family peptidase [Alphaproteobacteria bacterium]